MNTSKKISIGATGAAVAIGGVTISLVPNKTSERADLSTIHTEAVTGAPKETLPTVTQAQGTEETVESQESAASSVSVSTETYTSGKISIQYSAVGQLDDASEKDKVNGLLKTNVLSVIKTNDTDEADDTLDIKYRVIFVNHERLTTTYTGALSIKGTAHPANLSYSNTVNLPQAQNLELDNFTDAYTMAKYVLSDDAKPSDISSDVEARTLSYRSSIDLGSLTAVFNSVGSPPSSETQ